MSFVPLCRIQHVSQALRLAEWEIKVCHWHGHGQYVVNFGDGGPFSQPAYYHLTTFWCRRARLRRTLELLATPGVSPSLRESIAEEFACSPRPLRKVANAAVRAALARAITA